MKFIMRINPIPKGRVRSTGKRHYTPKLSEDFEDAVFDSVIADLHEQGFVSNENLRPARIARKLFRKRKLNYEPPFAKGQPVGAIFKFYREKDSGSPDFDNLTKAVSDALNGLLWHDDSQINGAYIEVHRKAGAENARIELEIVPIDIFRKMFPAKPVEVWESWKVWQYEGSRLLYLSESVLGALNACNEDTPHKLVFSDDEHSRTGMLSQDLPSDYRYEVRKQPTLD